MEEILYTPIKYDEKKKHYYFEKIVKGERYGYYYSDKKKDLVMEFAMVMGFHNYLRTNEYYEGKVNDDFIYLTLPERDKDDIYSFLMKRKETNELVQQFEFETLKECLQKQREIVGIVIEKKKKIIPKKVPKEKKVKVSNKLIKVLPKEQKLKVWIMIKDEILKGSRKKDIINKIHLATGISKEQHLETLYEDVTKYFREKSLEMNDIQNIVGSHLVIYEKLIGLFQELNHKGGRMTTMESKEKLLGLYKDTNTVEIIQENNNIVEAYDYSKLTPEEHRRLLELSTKVKMD